MNHKELLNNINTLETAYPGQDLSLLHQKAKAACLYHIQRPWWIDRTTLINNEGGLLQITFNCMTEALLAETWDKGFSLYWADMMRQYGYSYRHAESLDALLSNVNDHSLDLEYIPNRNDQHSEAETILSYEDGPSVLSIRYESVANKTESNVQNTINAILRNLTSKQLEIFFTWADIRSYAETAALCNCTPEEVRAIYNLVRSRRIRLENGVVPRNISRKLLSLST